MSGDVMGTRQVRKLEDMVHREQRLSRRVDEAYEAGRFGEAERQDELLAILRERIDSYGGQFASDYALDAGLNDNPPSVELELVAAWKAHLLCRACYETEDDLARIVRGVFAGHDAKAEALEAVSDRSLIATAKELYEKKARLVRKQRKVTLDPEESMDAGRSREADRCLGM